MTLIRTRDSSVFHEKSGQGIEVEMWHAVTASGAIEK